jgi:ABC-type multidrug transport system fused ATPase/permease subunit
MVRIKKQYQYIKKILIFGVKEKPQIWVSIILSLAGSVIEIFSMTLLYPLTLIAQGQAPDRKSKLHVIVDFVGGDGKKLLMIFLFLLLIRFVINLIIQAITIKVGKDLLAKISSKIFHNVIKNISISEITKNGIGHYTSIAGDESFRASMTIINLSQFFNLFCLTLLYYVALALFSFKSFVIITIFLIFCLMLMFTFFKKIQNLGVIQAEESRSTGLMFIDSLNNVKSIRCFNGEEFVVDSYIKKITYYTGVLFRADFYQVVLKVIPLILLIVLAMIVAQTNLDGSGKLDLVFCVSILAYLSRFFPALGQCLNTLLRLISDSKSGKDVLNLIESREDLSSSEVKRPLKEIADIEFENIKFSFDEKIIFDGFNYKFHKGQKYGIIGPSGSGKSTLIDLLLNFFPPSDGKILINGSTLNEITLNSLRSKIVLMEQRVTIFQASIFQNITLGAKFTLEEVKEVCKLVRMDEFIDSLPDKYETTIQYMGANLSGGQRQRIAMARAILRKPDVLVLDESLSALDPKTKEEIFNDLCNIFRNKILIIIAHDDWIIKQLSQIIDFKNMENYK